MMRRWKPRLIKPNGKSQRGDILLTKEVASALVSLILSGETLYPKTGKLTLYLYDGNGGETAIILPTTTLNSWVKRRNVLPDGRVLKEVLDEAREEYRTRKYEERKYATLKQAEQALDKALKMRTREPLTTKRGKVVINEKTGKPYMRENPRLLAEQMKIVRFMLERLCPEKYGVVR